MSCTCQSRACRRHTSGRQMMRLLVAVLVPALIFGGMYGWYRSVTTLSPEEARRAHYKALLERYEAGTMTPEDRAEMVIEGRRAHETFDKLKLKYGTAPVPTPAPAPAKD
jgi:hypothetical protein